MLAEQFDEIEFPSQDLRYPAKKNWLVDNPIAYQKTKGLVSIHLRLT